MKPLQCLCLFLFSLISLHLYAFDKEDFDKHFKLMPEPQKIELIKGKGISANTLRSVLLKGTTVKPVLYGVLQSLPLTSTAGAGVLELNITTSKNSAASPESYTIKINDNHVVINAVDQAGLFYGCQTLLQLLEDADAQQIEIPACTVTDYPDIAYRAIHLDLKHHLDAGRYYYDMIDRLAQVKVNAIIVEFEDKLRYRKAPLVGASHAISVDEFAAISRYAKERNIEISPLVQGLGHASFILKHDKYKNLRDTVTSDWSFDPMNPQTYDLQFSLYEDAIAATPYGKYLHVGGDEVGNLGMSELSKKSGLTPIQLQMQWLKKVCEFATAHNRIPIFWDDMVFKLSDLYQTTWDPKVPAEEVNKIWQANAHRLEENIGLFPKECVYMRWNYDSPDIPGNHKAIDWYKSHHLKAMAATAAQTMWPMLPREKSNFQPIKDFCRITAEKKMDGILCTAWDDCSPHFETYWRGLYDFGFFSWNHTDATADNVHSMFRQRFYAPALATASFEFQDSLEKALVFWESALIDKGDRSNYPRKIHLIELPDQKNNNAWSEKYKTKIQKAKEEVLRYQEIKNKLAKATQLARHNEYTLAVMNQINELQIYPAKLLVLLEKYDNASAAGKSAAKDGIKSYVNNFSTIRNNYEQIFSKTRIIANPADYILDQNHHDHLANGTNNSDWMYVYELAMNSKINDWFTSN
ncbi:glycoside hydrolase family 20 zincin-like fold domain-containing protein [Segetibacter koreensis]|uniref:glycoside hydrolase family 20 zincin-like fold domain-containing protein n=1 Tax=Segetibacter koreensis TaxID=398037 RepID=UPI0003710CFD|nr:glycoside hydrolase family 20 zincin-like fold domain-containing protein [Segetibacter koreensis]